jgi:predicted MFS family arabinose efflux permease
MLLLKSPIAVIVIAQLFGTSLWFSANGAAGNLMQSWGITEADIGLLTNAVQLGFIVGTLTFSLTGLADRFQASRIFTVSALLGALFNALFALSADGLASGMVLRFAVGFALAGVYPLGMKMVVSWVPERAGHVLAQLLGMLTLGTALPHGIRMLGADWPWQTTILVSTGLAVIAAAMIWTLGDGPHFQRKSGAAKIRLGRVLTAFTIPQFRASALAYFGHMWEVYAFWTLVPALLIVSNLAQPNTPALSGLAFLVVGIGTLSCMLGGQLSQRFGSARVAAFALMGSAASCALFPWLPIDQPAWLLALLLFWGASVVADSPQFSALSAKAAPPEIVGSALALQTAIGFSIGMVSIQLGTALVGMVGMYIAWLLLPGPLLALWALAPLWRKAPAALT